MVILSSMEQRIAPESQVRVDLSLLPSSVEKMASIMELTLNPALETVDKARAKVEV